MSNDAKASLGCLGFLLFALFPYILLAIIGVALDIDPSDIPKGVLWILVLGGYYLDCKILDAILKK